MNTTEATKAAREKSRANLSMVRWMTLLLVSVVIALVVVVIVLVSKLVDASDVSKKNAAHNDCRSSLVNSEYQDDWKFLSSGLDALNHNDSRGVASSLFVLNHMPNLDALVAAQCPPPVSPMTPTPTVPVPIAPSVSP